MKLGATARIGKNLNQTVLRTIAGTKSELPFWPKRPALFQADGGTHCLRISMSANQFNPHSGFAGRIEVQFYPVVVLCGDQVDAAVAVEV